MNTLVWTTETGETREADVNVDTRLIAEMFADVMPDLARVAG